VPVPTSHNTSPPGSKRTSKTTYNLSKVTQLDYTPNTGNWQENGKKMDDKDDKP